MKSSKHIIKGVFLAIGLLILRLQLTAQITSPIHLIDLKGKPAELKMGIDDSLLVVTFLLADCPACESYSKTLNDLNTKFTNCKVKMIGIFPGKYNTPAEMIAYQNQYKISFPLYQDPDKLVVHQLKATVAPEVFVLDRNDGVRYSGRIDDWMYAVGKKKIRIQHHDLADALEALTHQLPIQQSRTTPIGCIIE